MDFRKDFPIFQNRPELAYLDNAATSQKPSAVLDAERKYYEDYNSNIHRSAHFLAEKATTAYEDSRQAVADFVGAASKYEIVFTRNATESINLVARSYGDAFLKAGDRVLISKIEHHSNIVPWLQLKERTGIEIDYLEVDENGIFKLDDTKFTTKTKLVSVTGMSNSLGTINPLSELVEKAHKIGAKVLVDACQLAVHSPINVQELDVDFLVLSAHKLYGPTGVGVLYAKKELLEQMPPFLGGGEMIQEVFTDGFTPGDVPGKFEAGTPNIAGVITFGAALNYINSVGFEAIHKIESALTDYALTKLKELPFIKLIGPKNAENRGSVISFTMTGVHPHDIAEGLSSKNVAIRAGHHCCQILMDMWNLPATARISMAFYNTTDDIDKAIAALQETHQYFN